MILTDMRMPDIDGRALYQEIERRWPERARASSSSPATRSTSALREFVAESGRPVIEKPFLPSEVRRVVAELAAGPGRDMRLETKETIPAPRRNRQDIPAMQTGCSRGRIPLRATPSTEEG